MKSKGIKQHCCYVKTNFNLVLTFFFFSACSFAQSETYQSLLNKGKLSYKKSFNLDQASIDTFNFEQIANLFSKAIKINPTSSEARYFLGYTYSKMNSADARGIPAMNINLVLKSSEQFQKVIAQTPKYSGEFLALDPYSKLSAEWGAMGISYLSRNLEDSAGWAFKEGKKRGGFGAFILALNRKILDGCNLNSILISSGDNFTLPLHYLQTIEKYRTDVIVVDKNLLNSLWYPQFLSSKKNITFDLPQSQIDTLQFLFWKSKTVSINNISWILKPTYADQFLLRGDRILFSLLRANKFKREVYFTLATRESDMIGLQSFIYPLVAVSKITAPHEVKPGHEDYIKQISSLLSLSTYLNPNSVDEFYIYDVIRLNLLLKANEYIDSRKKNEAAQLIKLLDNYANEIKYPYATENTKSFSIFVRNKLTQ